jgi:2,5-dioxopentanoate dehydrogenase
VGLGGAELDAFVQSAAEAAAKAAPATMLHEGICRSYSAGTAVIGATPGVSVAGRSELEASAAAAQAACVIYRTELANLEAQPHLQHEVFGPCSIIAAAQSRSEVLHFAQQMEGQLTASLHGTEEDLAEYADLVRVLERKVGRIIFNGFPTGIEVCPSMHHGGPYPAASHSFFTSIGTSSIYRFVRPVCYQGFPDAALPELLRNKNTRGCFRLVDGVLSQADA